MPALALARALVELDPHVEPVLVGALRGVEASILPHHPYRHYLLPLEPVYRRQWWRNLRWPVLVWRIIRECNRLLAEEKPAVAVGTGGYTSGPVLLLASRRGVPILLQEQNAFPGLTTRRLARRARAVFLGFPEAAAHLRPGRGTAVHCFGNPIIPPPIPRPGRREAREALGIPQGTPVLLVTGGSQGARAINETVAHLVHSGSLEDSVLLWSTGRLSFEQCRLLDAPPRRRVRAFWDPMSEAYAVSDLAIARAGAMTTAELCAWGLPSILVPLPSAAAGHQTWNAEALAAAGAALHVLEADLSPDHLVGLVRQLLRDPGTLARMGQAARARGRPDAARKTASAILAMMS